MRSLTKSKNRNLRFYKQITSFVIFGLTFSFVGITNSQAEPIKKYLVTYKSNVLNTEKYRENNKVNARTLRVFDRNINASSVEMTPTQAANLKNNANILMIEEDTPVSVQTTQTVTSALWGLDRIDQKNLPLNQQYTYNNNGVGVKAFVVDTGIYANNPEFSAGQVVSGFTAVLDGNGTTDCNGHGTHVAGIIGGTNVGVAKNVTLVPVRVLDCTGSGFTSDVIAGLDWIRANNTPAKTVVNLSLGGAANTTLDTAIANLTSAGFTVVVAAGNSAANACNYSPSRAPSAITVAATTSADALATYSNRGSCVDIDAPGSAIYSSYLASYATLSGTSMASPHVAGVAALLLNANPTYTPSQVLTALANNAALNVLVGIPTGTVNRLLQVASGPTLTSQTIAFSAPSSVTYGAPSQTLSATSTSGLSVSFSIATGSTSVCSVSGVTLTILTAGNCVINANQAGNGTYAPATQVSQTFVINKASQSIAFSAFLPITFGSAAPSLTATSTSSLPISYSIATASAGVCSVSAGVLTIATAGMCSVNANQSGNVNYLAAPQQTQNLIINPSGAPATVPDAPTGVVFTANRAGSRSGTLVWNAPASNGGATISNFIITIYINGIVSPNKITVGNVLTASLTGLTRLASYSFAVQAKNSVGTSILSTRSIAVRIP